MDRRDGRKGTRVVKMMEKTTGNRIKIRGISHIGKENWDTVDLCDHVSLEGVATSGNEYFHEDFEYVDRILIRCKTCNKVYEVMILIN